MKTHIKLIMTLIAVVALGYCLNAIPSGTGSQHLRFTGYEELLAPPCRMEIRDGCC